MGLDKSRLHRESAFGPPSKEISVLDFIQNASKVQQSIRDSTKEGWDAIEQSERNSISEELGLGDIQAITDRIFLHKNYPDTFKKIYEQYTVKRKENDPPPSPYLKGISPFNIRAAHSNS
ncbi:hypothetical protein FRC19_003226 [Serendipita sp. 401]|nr:hypothetical protein FRC19_003226 [Serendipita sp. 401]KAG9057773.1 hypothetical protein FS842_004145 [Serendipita sp. 407]